MNMEPLIADARCRLDALDFSAERARIAQIDRQLGEIQTATKTADDRYQEVLVMLRPFNATAVGFVGSPILSEGDGRNVADALLAGAHPTQAAAVAVDRTALENERDALRQAMVDLARRQTALRNERGTIGPNAGRRIFAELEPLCDMIEGQAREAAKVIAGSFASLNAICGSTRTSSPALRATTEAMEGLRYAGGLLSMNDTVDVPADIADLLAIMAHKGPA